MENKLSRHKFLTSLVGTGSLLILNSSVLANPEIIAKNSKKNYNPGEYGDTFHPYFPSQNPELVQEFVVASHGQFEKVQTMLKDHPELAKSTWDWGYGDWETALGASSHTGNKEIAELLIANGARPDIFTFTMLGNLNAVKAMIEGNAGIQKVRGPHSITLLGHAKVRLANKSLSADDKTKAQAMVDYLISVGDADIKPINLPITDEEKKQFIGKFSFGNNPTDLFIIEINKNGALTIKREGQKFERPLLRITENNFAPLGAPHVEIAFELKDKTAVTLSINDPVLLVKAIRI
jgi:hypothetical protein